MKIKHIPDSDSKYQTKLTNLFKTQKRFLNVTSMIILLQHQKSRFTQIKLAYA